MARILYCWELGSNLGHIQRMLAIAEPIQEQGHKVFFALRDLSRADTVLNQRGIQYVQAPVWLPRAVNPPPSDNYAGILIRNGWLDSDGLYALTQAWLELFTLVQPDLILFDHSPTAALASRTLETKTAWISSTFEAPPLQTPLPPYRWWDAPRSKTLGVAEQGVLHCANTVLKRLNRRPMQALHDLFKADELLLSGFAETDHYFDREPAKYYGAVVPRTQGVTPPWPQVDGKRVFVYLMPEYAGFDKLFQALRALRLPVVAYVPGIGEQAIRRYSCPSIAFSPRPCGMDAVTESADLFICHSPGTMHNALLAGLPGLLLPKHLEQLMFAKRAEDLGAAICIIPGQTKPNYRKSIESLLNDGRFREAAEAFAAKYAKSDRNTAANDIAQACLDLIAVD